MTQCYAHRQWAVSSPTLIIAVFNGSTFGTGSLLFATVFKPNLVGLLGDQNIYLVVAGAAAMLISFTGMFDGVDPKFGWPSFLKRP